MPLSPSRAAAASKKIKRDRLDRLERRTSFSSQSETLKRRVCATCLAVCVCVRRDFWILTPPVLPRASCAALASPRPSAAMSGYPYAPLQSVSSPPPREEEQVDLVSQLYTAVSRKSNLPWKLRGRRSVRLDRQWLR